jgi:hypothetical protein
VPSVGNPPAGVRVLTLQRPPTTPHLHAHEGILDGIVSSPMKSPLPQRVAICHLQNQLPEI